MGPCMKQLTVSTSCRSSGPASLTMVWQTTDGTALLAAAQLPGGVAWCCTALLLRAIRGADSSAGTVAAAAAAAPPSCRIELLLLMCVWDKHRM